MWNIEYLDMCVVVVVVLSLLFEIVHSYILNQRMLIIC